MGTELPLTETVGMSIDGEWVSIADMIRAVRQQRAASVRVVKVIAFAGDSAGMRVPLEAAGWSHLDLLPGQSIAIIERRAEATAGEGEMP